VAAWVQTIGCGGSPISQSITVSAGSAILVVVEDASGATPATCTTSAAGTFVKVTPPGNIGTSTNCNAWLLASAAAGAQTITVTSAGFLNATITEISSPGTLRASVGQFQTGPNTTAGAITSTAVTTVAGDYVIGVSHETHGAASSLTAVAGTSRFSGFGNGMWFVVSDLTAAGTSQAMNYTSSDAAGIGFSTFALSFFTPTAGAPNLPPRKRRNLPGKGPLPLLVRAPIGGNLPPSIDVLPDTKTHFLGAYKPPGLLRFSQLYLSPAGDVPSPLVGEGNPHFVGKYAAPRLNRFSGSEDAGSCSLAPQPETNVRFIARHVPANLRGFRLGSEDAATSGPLPTQAETGAHQIGRFTPTNHRLYAGLWTNSAGDAQVVATPETNPHWVGRFGSGRLAGFLYNSQDTSSSGPQAETNTAFVGRFAPVPHVLLRAHGQNAAADVPVTVQPETGTHFVGRFAQPVLKRFVGSEDAATNGPVPQDANPHHVGRFQAAVLRGFAWNSADQASSGPLPTQAETNPHFVARYSQPSLLRFSWNTWDNYVTPPVQPETNTHFIGRFAQSRLLRFVGSEDAATNGPTPNQPETNPHYVGAYRAPRHLLSQYLWWTVPAFDVPVVAQPETNTHFVGRFAQSRLLRFVGSEDAASSGPLPVVGSGYIRSRVVNRMSDFLKGVPAVAAVFVTSTDHVTGISGATLTIYASKNGGAFNLISPSVVDTGFGWYSLYLSSADLNTVGDMAIHITAPGADPVDVLWKVNTGSPSDIRYVNGIPITGTGKPGDTWGPRPGA